MKKGIFIMYIVSALLAIVATIVAILMAACSKKADGVVYGKLDTTGRITNILLIPVYIALSTFTTVLSIFAYPNYDGFLGILGWIVVAIIAAAPLSCGLGLGFSVVLRKKGRSKQSFAVQFVGFVGIALTVGMYCLFAGNLLRSLN